MIDAAKGATLLVHEATFDDELQDEAVAKRHSTTAEAVGVAQAAGCYRTILTHFSTRYPKIPVIGDSFRDNVAVGFDLMTVNLVDLPWLPALVPVLNELFLEDQEQYERADAEMHG